MDPDQLSLLLQARRVERITQDEVTAWVDAHADAASSQLKRTTYLKLRRGNEAAAEFKRIIDSPYIEVESPALALSLLVLVRALVLECLAACQNCTQVYQAGEFRDYQDFEQCDDRLRSASGVFTPVPAPAWYTAPAHILGGEVLYQCQQCEAIWSLILPERAQRGSWCRIG